MRWAINSRNETLLKIIKKKGVAGVYNMRICGRHFTDDMYINTARLELTLCMYRYSLLNVLSSDVKIDYI